MQHQQKWTKTNNKQNILQLYSASAHQLKTEQEEGAVDYEVLSRTWLSWWCLGLCRRWNTAATDWTTKNLNKHKELCGNILSAMLGASEPNQLKLWGNEAKDCWFTERKNEKVEKTEDRDQRGSVLKRRRVCIPQSSYWPSSVAGRGGRHQFS